MRTLTIANGHGWRATSVAHRSQNGGRRRLADARGRRRESRVPTSPSSAGSNVIAATIITTTTMAAEKPSTATYGMPEISRPQIAITTVVPAKSTACPAVCNGVADRGLDLHARRRGSRDGG